MVITQGDIYWMELDTPKGSEPGYRHPHVVVQNNLFNRSKIRTVLVCPLTSNLKRADAPGNVLLKKGEAHLPRQSVVNVSQVLAVDKDELAEYIGTITPQRLREVLNGIKLVLEPREAD
ncbi:MAG: type II toxin-antitoxin system PemK/MazF family toxin [Thermodesulfobacteriota bacterium]